MFSVDHLHLIVIATEVILCYFVREDIPAKLIFTEVSPIGGLYVEINLSGIYNPNKHNITEYIETLSKSIDKHDILLIMKIFFRWEILMQVWIMLKFNK